MRPFGLVKKIAAPLWAGLIAFGLPLTSLAQDASPDERIYRDLSTQEMVTLLESAELTTRVTQGKGGEPLILAEREGLKFVLRGLECVSGAEVRCSKIQFRASFGLKEYPSVSWMNEFNKKWVFGKAYVGSDGVAHVEYPLNLTKGITEGNLINNFAIWGMVLDTFLELLAEGEIAPLA